MLRVARMLARLTGAGKMDFWWPNLKTSLRNLCVLCVSAVDSYGKGSTVETPRLRRARGADWDTTGFLHITSTGFQVSIA